MCGVVPKAGAKARFTSDEASLAYSARLGARPKCGLDGFRLQTARSTSLRRRHPEDSSPREREFAGSSPRHRYYDRHRPNAAFLASGSD